jgi:hypothetical protein
LRGEISANRAAIEAGYRKKPHHRCPKCGHECGRCGMKNPARTTYSIQYLDVCRTANPSRPCARSPSCW